MEQPLLPADAFGSASARITIDLGAIAANWQRLASLSGTAEAGAVLKADAYGLGACEVAGALWRAGCRTYFVATVPEGTQLRAVLPGARIFVLSGLWPGHESALAAADLIPVLASSEQLSCFLAMGRTHPFALGFDTGMNRLGFTAGDVPALAVLDPKPMMVMSHLACADARCHPANAAQRKEFEAVSRSFEGIESSLASSCGIFLGQDYCFDLTRPGIALYGGGSIAGEPNAMQPALKAEARILQIRQAASGTTVSYGATHRLARDSRLAIAGAGYADGWHRALSGSGVPLRETGETGGYGVVNGHRVPIVGRVTMDLTTFDITDVPAGAVAAGDQISLIGDGITLDDAAAAAGTIGYELLTSLGRRYERRYV